MALYKDIDKLELYVCLFTTLCSLCNGVLNVRRLSLAFELSKQYQGLGSA